MLKLSATECSLLVLVVNKTRFPINWLRQISYFHERGEPAVNVTRGQHLIGKRLGSCVLERLSGYGGSSAVFLAQDSQSEQKVAVKVFLPRDDLSSRVQRDCFRRFLHEAEAVSQLDHPNILPILSDGEEDGLPYIVMSY